ncbi:hypothetical protein EG329_012271 [Mollisiaceae sp. DMI_Dod_QoI]|nr:hypothetical protein EG329_012271 [Helotiales sp. DMI_Dod_QoI]
MATHAKITLTALDGNVTPVERILILEPSSPTAPIGRASKSISKGLFSAVDNAWFDSPVMSREHAQITMNAEDKIITIQDIGSMHGTHLNDTELARNVPSTVNNGDTVVFGAEVRRGPETFPACSFRVNYEFTQTQTANTFAFPESSDIEDAEGEEDYDFSEDENAGKHQQSSEDGVSIESSSPKVSKISDAIDLTRDDSPDPSSSNRIDLTSETPTETTKDLLVSPYAELSARLNAERARAPILVESEDEEAGFSSDSADQSIDISNDTDDSEDSVCCMEEEVFDASDDSEGGESEDMVIDDSYDVEGVHDFSDADSEKAPAVDHLTRFSRPTHDDPTILLSDIRTRTQLPESVADDEDDNDDGESEFGLAEAGEAGIRALFDDGLLQDENKSHSDDEPESELKNDSEIVNTSAVSLTVGEATTPVASPPSLPPVEVSKKHRFDTLQNFTGHRLGLSYPSIRQPSPSDAAMVKTALPQQEDRYPAGVCEVGTFGKSPVQILGEKTGKNAFFEAREANKVKFKNAFFEAREASKPKFTEEKKPSVNFNVSTSARDGQTTTVVSSGTTPVKIFRNSGFGHSLAPVASISSGRDIRRVGFGFGHSFSTNSKVIPVPEPAFPTREPCSFLDKPDQNAIPARTPSPQLDMTSAYSFHVSKASAISPAKTNSRGIKINDIIDTSTPQRPLRFKRKADEISDVTDKELRMWAKASTASNASKIATESNITESHIATQTIIPQPIFTNSATTESRPTKRIKKLLENVGYAALGGVAVGAGLFTVLVATAPDFL